MQGHHELALDAYLRVSDPAVFAFITKFTLFEAAARDAPRLFNVDAAAAVALLVGAADAVSSSDVAAALLRTQVRTRAECNV